MRTSLLLLILLTLVSGSYAENMFNEKMYKPLVSDRKASRVGDLITLVIVETSKAEARAGTGIDKETDMTISGYDTTRTPSVGLNFDRRSEADARTARKGFLQAQIAVSIVDITENGNYQVEGKQILTINREEQIITLKGLLRADDISKDNMALSNRLANATIEFTGEGIVGDEQRKGIIATILSWLGII